jgi:hypothetical protein
VHVMEHQGTSRYYGSVRGQEKCQGQPGRKEGNDHSRKECVSRRKYAVMNMYNPSIWEAEARESPGPAQTGVHSKTLSHKVKKGAQSWLTLYSTHLASQRP